MEDIIEIVKERFKKINHSKLAFDTNSTTLFLWIELFDDDVKAQSDIEDMVEDLKKQSDIVIGTIILEVIDDLPVSSDFTIINIQK